MKEFTYWMDHPYYVVDGDTFDCQLDLGLNVHIHPVRIRLKGVDAPEMRNSTVVGIPEDAAAARKRLHEILQGLTAPAYLVSHNRDGWGRLVATPYLPDGTSLQDVLLKEGLVKVWKK